MNMRASANPHVVIVSASSEPVGVSTHVLNLARLLRSVELLDTVVCPNEGWLVDQLRAEGLSVQVLPLSFRPHAYARSAWALWRFLATRPTETIAHLHGRFPLFLALPSILVLRGRTFVSTLHEFPSTETDGVGGWKRRLETFALRQLAALSCVSQALEHHAAKRLGVTYTGRLLWINNWIEPCAASTQTLRLPVAEHPLSVCAIGRLAAVKGFNVLIEAIGVLHGNGHNVRCDIYGDGSEAATLRALIARRGLESVVSLCGSQPDVRLRMNAYRVVAIPSIQESFGLVALEAFNAGVPVVASDVPGLNEVVRHGESGLLFPAGDAAALAERLLEVTRDARLSRQLISGGAACLRTFLPGETLIDRYRILYGVSGSVK